MTWGIRQIFTRAHSKVWKFGLPLGFFIQNRKFMSLKFTEELCVMKTKNDAKIEENLNCQFKIDIKNLMILTRALENLENLHFNKLLSTKVYNIWGKKKYGGVTFDCTEDWCKIWRKTDLYFLKCHEEFGKFSPEHVRKSKNLESYWLLLPKVENLWA